MSSFSTSYSVHVGIMPTWMILAMCIAFALFLVLGSVTGLVLWLSLKKK